MSKYAISKCEKKLKCKVNKFVTDNAAYVLKMSAELLKDNDYDLICNESSAYILNLLAKDFEIKNITKHVIKQ